MTEISAFPQRIRERLRAEGYWKGGRADVGRFCMEKAILPSYVYRWLEGQIPRGDKLVELARALNVTAEWLVTGVTPPAPAADTSVAGPARGARASSRTARRAAKSTLVAVAALLTSSGLAWGSPAPVTASGGILTPDNLSTRRIMSTRRRRFRVAA